MMLGSHSSQDGGHHVEESQRTYNSKNRIQNGRTGNDRYVSNNLSKREVGLGFGQISGNEGNDWENWMQNMNCESETDVRDFDSFPEVNN